MQIEENAAPLEGDVLPPGGPEFIGGTDTGVQPEPATEPATEPEAEPKAEPEPEPQSEDPKPEPEGEKTKTERRIAELTREKWEARREAEAARAQADELRRRYEPPADPNAPKAADDPHEIARQIVETERFNAACNDVYTKGTSEFPDFTASLDNLRPVLSETVIRAAMASGDAAKVLHALGSDFDEANRVARLQPLAMVAEMTKIAMRQPAPVAPPPAPVVSKAPAPIKPIVGAGKVETDPAKMTMEEWEKKHPLPSRR